MSADFVNQRIVKKTRKAKRCQWCSELIPAGSYCTVIAGSFEGDFFADKYHTECAESSNKWCELNRDEEFPGFGEMVRGSIEWRDQ